MCLFLNKVEIPKKIGKMLGSSQKKIVSLQPKMNQPISDGQPTRKGLYIHNGRKVVMK